MNMKKRMLSIVLSGAMAVSTAVSAGSFGAFAVAQCVAYSGSNVNDQDYVQWSDTVKSYLTVCDNGNYMRVQSGAIKGKLRVEYYSSDFEPLSTYLAVSHLPVGQPHVKAGGLQLAEGILGKQVIQLGGGGGQNRVAWDFLAQGETVHDDKCRRSFHKTFPSLPGAGAPGQCLVSLGWRSE